MRIAGMALMGALAASLVASLVTPLAAQDIKLPVNLDALAEKADEAVTVTMDKSMLQLAARFLHDRDDEEAQVRQLIAGLDSIYVRSFEFKSEGEYSMADVEAVRALGH